MHLILLLTSLVALASNDVPGQLKNCFGPLGEATVGGSAPVPTNKDPGGVVGLTPSQEFVLFSYIGGGVEGGYAKHPRKAPNAVDELAGVRIDGNKTIPTFSVHKKIFGDELARNSKFRDQVDALVALHRPSARDKKATMPTRKQLKDLVFLLGTEAKKALEDKQMDPETAVAHFVVLRTSMVPLDGPVVRAVLSHEVGLGNGVPKVGDPIQYSSTGGAVISANPPSRLQDSIAYGRGKIRRYDTEKGQKSGSKVLILIYPPEEMRGVSLKSMPKETIDVVENHLRTGNTPDGKPFVDTDVVVSRDEVIVSPKSDLVVTRVEPSKDSDVVYIHMGRPRPATTDK